MVTVPEIKVCRSELVDLFVRQMMLFWIKKRNRFLFDCVMATKALFGDPLAQGRRSGRILATNAVAAIHMLLNAFIKGAFGMCFERKVDLLESFHAIGCQMQRSKTRLDLFAFPPHMYGRVRDETVSFPRTWFQSVRDFSSCGAPPLATTE